MDGFWQAVAGALVALILLSVLRRQGADISVLLGIAVCCMVLAAAASFLGPVIEFVGKLRQTAKLDGEIFAIALKAAGVGLIGQLAALLCTDAGCSALGKTVEKLTAAAIIYLSLPLMNALLELVQTITGEL